MEGFEEIYSAYFSDVYKYVRCLATDENIAEEIAEETFFRALRSLSSFRGECEVRIWLCRIARNLFYQEKRKEKRNATEEVSPEIPDASDMVLCSEERETARGIRETAARLPGPYGEVFALRVLGERGFEEIGQLMGKNAHWACVTYHRACDKIRREMDGYERD